MPDGTGLKEFSKNFPKRFFDVGIAEEHAVTLSAGMAASGLKPVFAVYSTFLQRAYDEIIHDVCIQNLPVVFCIDRAGVVGEDGETHQGIYDISYLSHMPNMLVMAPKNRYEMEKMLDFAYSYDGPIAIKYPRGTAYKGLEDFNDPIVAGKSEIIYEGSEIAVLACGNMMEEAVKLYDRLKCEGKNPTLVNVRFVSCIDMEMLDMVCRKHKLVVTMEENIRKGGYGELFAATLLDKGYDSDKKMIHIDASINKEIVPHGKISELRDMLGISAEKIYEAIIDKDN